MADEEQLSSASPDLLDDSRIPVAPLDINWYKELQSFPTNRRSSEIDWINESASVEDEILEGGVSWGS